MGLSSSEDRMIN